MNPYLHEVAHRLRSRSTIGVVLVALLATAVGVSTVYNAAPSVGIDAVGYAYYAGGALHLDLWALDVLGEGVSGVRAEVAFVPVSNSTVFPPPPLPPPLYTTNVTSDASGVLAVPAPVPVGNYLVEVSAHDPELPQATLTGLLSSSFLVSPGADGAVQLLGPAFNTVPVGNYIAQDRLLVFWAGANGTAPAGLRLDACAPVTQEFSGPPANCSGLSTTTLGSVNAYLTFFAYPSLPTPALGVDQTVFTTLELVNATGAVLAASSFQGAFGPAPPSVTAPYSIDVAPGVGVLTSYAFDLGFFLPIAGFVMVYWGTTRPRASGSVDMVLVRPVTRRGIFLAQYAAVVVVLLASAAAEVLAFDLYATLLLGESLPASFVPALIAGALVAGLAFSGLLLLASHLFRTTGPTLATGIAVLLATSLFWSAILFLAVVSTGASANGAEYSALLLRSQLVAPPQYVGVIAGSLTLTSTDGLANGVTYASVGVGTAVVVVAGLVWVLAPLLAAFFRATRQD